MRHPSITLYATALLGCFFVILIFRAFIPVPVPAAPPLASPVKCIGEPIVVDYPFEGGFLDPHACAVQCMDQRRRYVVYSNGKATQCETLPGCNDAGEDSGTTCVPPFLTTSIDPVKK